ncbi:MAG: B12-binding domain-containing radical SAM protein [Candidatus Omnitrophica bacterium]|nr:B12-binding domain-containing radical SAM protein [Candidatus Omnitrophota bacterium]
MCNRIVLIRPNICVRKEFTFHNLTSPPLGLAYLAASLIEQGFEVKIIDMVLVDEGTRPYRDTHTCYGQADDSLVAQLKAYGPAIIGIGSFVSQYARTKEIVAAIKGSGISANIVLGGAGPSSMPARMLLEAGADFALQGEAERTFLELAMCLRNGDYEKTKHIDGIVFKEKEKVVVRPKQHYEDDLNLLPWPARQLFDNARYLRCHEPMPIITSRGCPGRCAFCSAYLIAGRKWRGRDPIDVVNEIEEINKIWGYKIISIFDDACNVDSQRLIAICRELVKRKLKIKLVFPHGLIIKYITKEVLYWIQQAGGVSLTIPIEHSNNTMRNHIIRKEVEIQEILNVLTWCREFRLLTNVNFVLGMPGETEETLLEINNFVKDNALLFDSIGLYFATPFPGTPFHERCVKEGYLAESAENDYLEFDVFAPVITTSTLSGERVHNYKEMILKTFLDYRKHELPADFIRLAMRKPDDEMLQRINEIYFSALNS